MMRELAHVLPNGVWLQQASAADSLSDAADTQAGQGFSGGTSGASTTVSSTTPVMTLTGCAQSQADVATMLVRLREMQGVNNVQLDHSTQPDSSGGASSGSSGGASSGSSDCGTTKGQSNWGWQADVAFDAHALAPYQPGAVPTTLGVGQCPSPLATPST